MVGFGGYAMRFLNVDLADQRLVEEVPDRSLFRAFVGGYGVGAQVLLRRMGGGEDSLGPGNILGIVTGPLTGTPVPASGRYCVVGKSPLTGGWGDANSGGRFGPALKGAGYDAIFVSGIAEKPAYLLLEDGQAALCPADDLWGLDCVETQEVLRSRHGSDVQVACIGPAGERLARIACVITDGGRAAARSGLGAVMGSKKLKAIAVRGSRKTPVAAPDRVQKLRQKYLPALKSGMGEALHRYGTAGFTAELIGLGRTPIRNWQGTVDDYPHPEAIDGPALAALETRKYGCWHCPIACGAMVRWEWAGRTMEGHRAEYETLAALGTYCGIDDLRAISTMNEMCNRAGLDTISAGAIIAFAMECYQKGIIGRDDLEGLALEWGDGKAAVCLLEQMIERRGLGDLLADGVARASHALGRGSEAFAMHAGGQELPAHDPRHLNDLALQYQLSPTPGRHTQGGGWAAEMTPEAIAALGLDLDLRAREPVQFRARAYAAHLTWWNVIQASGLCYFAVDMTGADYLQEFLSAVTGWDFSIGEILQAGERIETARHLFGLREGCNPLLTTVAARALGNPAQTSGPNAGVTVDVGELCRHYLRIMDWDPVTTMPSRERLELLELSGLVETAGLG